LAFAASSEPGQRGISDVEHARLMQRVARAIANSGERDGLVRLRLSPPELGALRMEIALRDGLVHARLEAETSQARTLIVEGLPSLRDRLAEQNLQLGQCDVDLMPSFTGGLPQRSQDDAREMPASPRGEQRDTPRDAPVLEAVTTLGRDSTQRLNVII
jgi:flagellar hook-length control protein FliK